ncbi:MAG: hypothetical protein HY558_06430 [Euryarchaeota archaeon]|nr:hypothetical protein [Euryarchaeota archaeon]
MKKLELVFPEWRWPQLQRVLEENKVSRYIVTPVRAHGAPRVYQWRGDSYLSPLHGRLLLGAVVPEDEVQHIGSLLLGAAGPEADLLVLPVEAAGEAPRVARTVPE